MVFKGKKYIKDIINIKLFNGNRKQGKSNMNKRKYKKLATIEWGYKSMSKQT